MARTPARSFAAEGQLAYRAGANCRKAATTTWRLQTSITTTADKRL